MYRFFSRFTIFCFLVIMPVVLASCTKAEETRAAETPAYEWEGYELREDSAELLLQLQNSPSAGCNWSVTVEDPEILTVTELEVSAEERQNHLMALAGETAPKAEGADSGYGGAAGGPCPKRLSFRAGPKEGETRIVMYYRCPGEEQSEEPARTLRVRVCKGKITVLEETRSGDR